MDRRFLSDPRVIEASRRFVCIRLATYENAAERSLLTKLFLGRSGQLENTTFAILDSDGRTQLVAPGRSPDRAFDGPADMASFMTQAAPRRAKPERELPVVDSVRLALNVAACDGLPLVVVHGKDEASRKALARSLEPLAWGSLAGRCVFATTSQRRDLEAIKGNTAPGILVIQPGTYGLRGTVLGCVTATATGVALERALQAPLAKHRPPAATDVRGHVRAGSREGVWWETLLPVTDPGPRSRR